jgi:hypothetical protein
MCLCECGTKKLVLQNTLRKGVTTSCGCHRREWAKNHAMTHGLSKTRTYRCWALNRRPWIWKKKEAQADTEREFWR